MNTLFARWAGLRNEFVFALLFLAVFAALASLYHASRGTVVERILIDVVTVKPSAALIHFLTPSEQVAARGHLLISPNARLSVLNGCEGIETILLLAAAILAYRTSWRRKAIGVLLGTLVIYALNQVRIVTLFYAFHYDRELFNSLHGYVAPLILILLAGFYFLWWLSWQSPISDAAQTPV